MNKKSISTSMFNLHDAFSKNQLIDSANSQIDDYKNQSVLQTIFENKQVC